MTDNITFKRGATFSSAVTLTVVENGVSITDLTGWTGRSQLRSVTGALVQELTFAWINPVTRQCVLSAASTTAWPLGRVQLDVVLTSPAGAKVPTPTLDFTVTEGVTRD